MKTVNTISGGKSSAANAILYPSDFNVFSLVHIDEPINEDRFNCLWMNGKDEPTRKIISDRIGFDFYGTAEDDIIIYTILDLEQKLGKKIDIITGQSFDNVIKYSGRCLPDPLRRFCTEEMKVKPMFEWWKKNINEVALFRFGFRKGEERRAVKMLEKCNSKGNLEIKTIVGTSKNGNRNKWGIVEWQKPEFKLIENLITRDKVQELANSLKIRFADFNNCGNCFHRNALLISKQARTHENIREVIKWASTKEGVKNKKDLWLKDKQITMKQVLKFSEQKSILDELETKDFNECDSGYCGL